MPIPICRRWLKSGVKGMDLMGWFGSFVPSATPKAIVDQLNKAFNQVESTEETKKFLNSFGGDPWIVSPWESQAHLVSQIKARQIYENRKDPAAGLAPYCLDRPGVSGFGRKGRRRSVPGSRSGRSLNLAPSGKPDYHARSAADKTHPMELSCKALVLRHPFYYPHQSFIGILREAPRFR